jgi:hypothetical protein
MFIGNVGVNLQHCAVSRLINEVRKPNDVLFLLQTYEQNLDALKRVPLKLLTHEKSRKKINLRSLYDHTFFSV